MFVTATPGTVQIVVLRRALDGPRTTADGSLAVAPAPPPPVVLKGTPRVQGVGTRLDLRL
jgi:hypothetical protein